jgi:Tannase and feruloyl esterase
MADQILTVARTRMAGLKRPLSWLALSAVVAGSVGVAGPAAAQRGTVAVHAGSTAAARAAAARANPANRLGVVKPAMACSQLATLDLAGMTGIPVLIGSAAPATATPGGWPACEVVGNIGPQEKFKAFLPTSTWRQLYLQTGCGGLCGAVKITALQATGCVPLTSGQSVMASDNEGHYGTATFVPATFDATFGADPQLREYFGHLSEHVLAVFMKKLIKIFYGMSPARSFYDGCSGGGREALVEAQQWPRDFNGVVAGAPASITQPLSVWDSGWNALANLGPHGQPILTAAKLPVLHAAAVKACGRLNGLVMDPMTCTFNPASVQCPPHAASTANCLTAAQVTVARKLYEGLILYHGLADPAISPIGTIAYYQAIEDHMGGPAATEKFARLFLMPGMGHCAGGQGPNSFDALTAIINWAEQGAAPKSLLTTQQPSPGNPVRSLPAYPYPLMATHNGTGSVDVASSYHAALPAKPFNAHIHWLGSFSPSSPRQ